MYCKKHISSTIRRRGRTSLHDVSFRWPVRYIGTSVKKRDGGNGESSVNFGNERKNEGARGKNESEKKRIPRDER